MRKNILLLLLLFASLNLFAQWQVTSGPHGAGTTSSLAVEDTFVYAGTETGGVFKSSDRGDNWTAANNGLTNMNNVKALAVEGPNIYAGVHYSLGDAAVFKSTDHASTWTATPLQFLFMYSLIVNPQIMIAGTWYGIYVSNDGGASWQNYTAGLPSNASVFTLAFSGLKIFAGVNGSTISGTTVYSSVTGGTSWTAFNTGLSASGDINVVTVFGADVFAGTTSGIFKSGTITASWSAANSGLTNTYVRSFHPLGGDLFAGTDNGVFLTSNGGANWVDISAGLPANAKIYSMASDSTYLYAGTDSVVWRRPLNQIAGISANEISGNDFSMYPNPATKDILVAIGREPSGAKKKYELNIVDLAGEKILHRSMDGENTSLIDVSSLPAGVYFITLSDGEKKSITKKLVKM